MRLPPLVMLAALVPAGANPSLVARAAGIAVPLCTAEEGAAQITIRLGDPVLPGSEATLCCAKGCHASERKKKAKRART